MALAAVLGLLLVSVADAATSLSNSLTGFTGVSPDAGVQSAVGAAGFEFASIAGLAEDFTSDPTIELSSSGATFGSLYGGDGGRNYMRTIEGDYATGNFVAEITFSVTADNQAVFFGLGTGDIALFGTPDWSTQFSSASFWPETGNDKFVRFQTANDVNAFADTTVAGFDVGTHRMRMTLNNANNQLLGEIDVNYAGGPFAADAVTNNLPIDVSSLFAEDGWPTEPSRIYFGGDDGAIFKDFAVTVGGAEDADFNSDGSVDGQDFLIWQRGLGVGVDNGTGDANGSGTVDAADLAIWKSRFGGAATVAVGAIPEPSTAVLVLLALAGAALTRRP
jgi:hypothetical protein